MSQPTPTVRVRIAVAVGPDGQWNTSGWGTAQGLKDPNLAMGLASEVLEDGSARYWLEADLPLPITPVVDAHVQSDANP